VTRPVSRSLSVAGLNSLPHCRQAYLAPLSVALYCPQEETVEEWMGASSKFSEIGLEAEDHSSHALYLATWKGVMWGCPPKSGDPACSLPGGCLSRLLPQGLQRPAAPAGSPTHQTSGLACLGGG
jgi:hypothetical protein